MGKKAKRTKEKRSREEQHNTKNVDEPASKKLNSSILKQAILPKNTTVLSQSPKVVSAPKIAPLPLAKAKSFSKLSLPFNKSVKTASSEPQDYLAGIVSKSYGGLQINSFPLAEAKSLPKSSLTLNKSVKTATSEPQDYLAETVINSSVSLQATSLPLDEAKSSKTSFPLNKSVKAASSEPQDYLAEIVLKSSGGLQATSLPLVEAKSPKLSIILNKSDKTALSEPQENLADIVVESSGGLQANSLPLDEVKSSSKLSFPLNKSVKTASSEPQDYPAKIGSKPSGGLQATSLPLIEAKTSPKLNLTSNKSVKTVLFEPQENLAEIVVKSSGGLQANSVRQKLIDPKDQIINDLKLKVTKLIEENKKIGNELSILKENSEKLKSGLYCAICLNYYHVPHNLECGHVFCFSCIRGWLSSLVSKEAKLHCPLCRLKVEKSPSFVLTLHLHLLETLELEESKHPKVLSSIKNHLECFENEPKKWQNIFPECGIRAAIWDNDDAVARCTTCNWEVVGKSCANCAAAYSGESEIEKTDSDTCDSDVSSHSCGSDLGGDHIEREEHSEASNDSFVCQDSEVDFDSDGSSTTSSPNVDPSGVADSESVFLIESEIESASDDDGFSESKQKPRSRQVVISDSE